MKRFQDGEMGAFDDIVDRYKNYVYSQAYYFTQNCDDAYDVSQEVFLKVFKSLNRLRNSLVFEAWLRRIIVNTALDYLRQRPKEKEFQNPSDILSIGHISDELPDSPIYAKELQGKILNAIDQLPDKQKKVFILRYYDDLPLEEIAKTLGRSTGTVKANLFYATQKIKKLVEAYMY
ncbi:RNA polymerase sigma factor [Candidatus Poribacteria bacterium]|nr:RNA polymerase sigma factor [Candidatus Poribacteria bacterium]